MSENQSMGEPVAEKNISNPTGLEIIAIATDEATLEAAVAAKSDSVLFRVVRLNAGRRVGGFRPGHLKRAVEATHRRGAKAYLGLTQCIAEAELTHAVGILEVARDCGIDALLISDPSLLVLRNEYPELVFHLTASGGINNSADVSAARELSIPRVACSDELSIEELTTAAEDSDVMVELHNLASKFELNELQDAGLTGVVIDTKHLLSEQDANLSEDIDSSYCLEILLEGKQVQIRCECRDHVVEWAIPKTVVRRPQKAVSVGKLLEFLEVSPVREHWLYEASTDDPDFLLVPRASNAVISRISTIIHQAVKKDSKPQLEDVPESVGRWLEPQEPDPANTRTPADQPDRARLHASDVELFMVDARPSGGVVVEGATAETLRDIHKACRRMPLVVALPAVFHEQQIPEIQELLELCAKLRTIVEVNSWGGWHLARPFGLRVESGPGLAVWNTLSAQSLAQLGIQTVTLPPQARRRQLEEVTIHCPVSNSLIVFGRPALAISRDEPSQETKAATGKRRGNAVMDWRCEQDLWVARPHELIDLRNAHHANISVRHLVVDLVTSPNPIGEWLELSLPQVP